MMETAPPVFGEPPQAMAFAPGRVELLGNHTDYNQGAVLTTAIHLGITLYGRRRDDRQCRFFSHEMNETATFPLDTAVPGDPGWANYPRGVLQQLMAHPADIGGMDVVIQSTLPLGAGVSSSAALEVSVAMLARTLYPFEADRMTIARLCQRAENEFVGMPCGLLDQFSSVMGQPGYALRLDCRTGDHEAIEFPHPVPAIVLCQSGVRHTLVESAYAERRAQCEAARDVLIQATGRSAEGLCEFTPEECRANRERMDPVVYQRAIHVTSEHARVNHGADQLRVGDMQGFGQQMMQSHASSRDFFQNSCPELDHLVEWASAHDACIGSKLTGGGFGGATVHLVEESRTGQFAEAMQESFTQTYGTPCDVLVCQMGPGAYGCPVDPSSVS